MTALATLVSLKTEGRSPLKWRSAEQITMPYRSLRSIAGLALWILCICAIGCDLGRPTASNPLAPSNATTVQKPAIPETMSGSTNPTNSGVNVRDRDSSAKTPLDQNENSTDIKITADIRKQVVASDMSINAQNVKIITQDGKVTLRGPVETDAEKKRIEEIALSVAGAEKVDNQLEVNRK